jgi:hypothetical protein
MYCYGPLSVCLFLYQEEKKLLCLLITKKEGLKTNLPGHPVVFGSIPLPLTTKLLLRHMEKKELESGDESVRYCWVANVGRGYRIKYDVGGQCGLLLLKAKTTLNVVISQMSLA